MRWIVYRLLSPDCQKELGWTISSLRKCIRPLVENGLRAHDDDPRVPVLANRHGCEKPCYDAGSRARRLTVFSSFLFFKLLIHCPRRDPSRLTRNTAHLLQPSAGIVAARAHLRVQRNGGEGGILLLGTVSRTPVFKTGAFNHSATSPELLQFYYSPQLSRLRTASSH